MESLLLYTGLCVTLVGGISLWHPLKVLGIPSKARCAVVLFLGLAGGATAVVLPAPLEESKVARTRIDDFVPTWQFGEIHEIRAHASPDQVYHPLRATTTHALPFFRL